MNHHNGLTHRFRLTESAFKPNSSPARNGGGRSAE